MVIVLLTAAVINGFRDRLPGTSTPGKNPSPPPFPDPGRWPEPRPRHFNSSSLENEA